MSNLFSDLPSVDAVSTDSGLLAVTRAVAELRQGREVELTGSASVTVAAVESLLPADLPAMRNPLGGFSLLLSPARAEFLGLGVPTESLLINLNADTSLNQMRQLAGLDAEPWSDEQPLDAQVFGEDWVEPALSLAKQGRLAPALLVHVAQGRLQASDRLSVSTLDVTAYPSARGSLLERVSSANVPLAAHPNCEFILWRERYGDCDHLAIRVGEPDLNGPVLVRLHSSCLTGDLFASLRCDCGEQLQGAIARMAAEGGGVLLYLSQEGRGIGLVNKLRAYQLQDKAHDTVEADRYLGFSSDERDYSMAYTMLAELGVDQVRVMTNNPLKIKALVSAGIHVVERVAINIVPNAVNTRYIRTKHERVGHLGPDASAENIVKP